MKRCDISTRGCIYPRPLNGLQDSGDGADLIRINANLP